MKLITGIDVFREPSALSFIEILIEGDDGGDLNHEMCVRSKPAIADAFGRALDFAARRRPDWLISEQISLDYLTHGLEFCSAGEEPEASWKSPRTACKKAKKDATKENAALVGSCIGLTGLLIMDLLWVDGIEPS